MNHGGRLSAADAGTTLDQEGRDGQLSRIAYMVLAFRCQKAVCINYGNKRIHNTTASITAPEYWFQLNLIPHLHETCKISFF